MKCILWNFLLKTRTSLVLCQNLYNFKVFYFTEGNSRETKVFQKTAAQKAGQGQSFPHPLPTRFHGQLRMKNAPKKLPGTQNYYLFTKSEAPNLFISSSHLNLLLKVSVLKNRKKFIRTYSQLNPGGKRHVIISYHNFRRWQSSILEAPRRKTAKISRLEKSVFEKNFPVRQVLRLSEEKKLHAAQM